MSNFYENRKILKDKFNLIQNHQTESEESISTISIHMEAIRFFVRILCWDNYGAKTKQIPGRHAFASSLLPCFIPMRILETKHWLGNSKINGIKSITKWDVGLVPRCCE